MGLKVGTIAITINFGQKKEARLRALAAEAGQTLEEYVIDLVMRHFDELDAEDKAAGQT